MAVDHHPFAIADAAHGESGDVNLRAIDLAAAAALDRVDAESADSNVFQLRSPAM
jgi:hypothetical protein